jgi:hypothetical protein
MWARSEFRETNKSKVMMLLQITLEEWACFVPQPVVSSVRLEDYESRASKICPNPANDLQS